ncbi:hypothetical protein ASD45_08400 [Pseudolabrys sp. Root1462]|uniref:hypothetical protein n=1 Tax=Pseudolabrys sp. Root1462 TaxID=1736466 RepID=UPI0007024AE3|nr:hypothetical protein [Pseudolabrys sp. Root1462]KQZ00873.1 hypothetical protein ASD45_08400 [Pseudolabrys sp. Root1462]
MERHSSARVGTPGVTDIVDPHCVPVVPGHELLMHNLPNGNVLLTLLTHHIEPDGSLIGVVTCRVEWQPERLKAVHDRLMAAMDAGPLLTMEPANMIAV